MTVDRDSIVNNVSNVGYIPAYAMTPANTMGYTAESDLHYDPERARQLLASAGYPDGEGFPILEILYNTQEQHRKIAVAIQQMWKQELNIDVTLINQDWKVYLDSVSTKNYQVARAGWIGDYVDANSFLDMWLTDSGNNRTGWGSDLYDQLISETAPSAATQELRYAAFRQAEKILLEDMPVIPIYTYVSKHLMHSSVKGLSGNYMDYPVFKYIYLSEES